MRRLPDPVRRAPFENKLTRTENKTTFPRKSLPCKNLRSEIKQASIILVAYNVLNAGPQSFRMPNSSFAGPFAGTNLAEVLQMLIQAKKSGLLVIQSGEEQGSVAVENGMILNAQAGSYAGMHALFQFVSWPEAHFQFREQSLEANLPRDLAVYDPQVLIAGVAEKMTAAAG